MRFENEFAGLTIKQILTDRLGFSKRAITALKSRPDGILLNGIHATVRATVSDGDILEINCDDQSANTEKLVPSSVLPNVIYEDDHIIALNKPPFMPTHQSQGHFNEQGRNCVFRSGNRLDRNTSGIVLVAKDRVSSAKLSGCMKQNKIRKSYIAILSGILSDKSGTIETHIRRREKSIILREACDECEDSKLAITVYEVLAQANGLSLVKATPLTGRTHQLRVHFAHLGAPILGDDLYGSSSDLINRHALHAYSLLFPHPELKNTVKLYADIPNDMASIIEKYFGKECFKDGRAND